MGKLEFVVKENILGKVNRHWQFSIGSGHAPLALRTDYVEQLQFIRNELGVERVRFHGILSDDMHTFHSLKDIIPVDGAEKFKDWSFDQVGLVYDNILKCGVKPFVEISFMPRELAKSGKTGVFFYKPIISLPDSMEAWGEYIRSFVRYLIRRYGIEEVRTWYFEVWNEPDLQMVFFDGTMEDYFDFFRETFHAIKSVDHEIRVGGPSTSGCKWVGEFLSYCREHNLLPDFVSSHQYAGDPIGGVTEDKGANEFSPTRMKEVLKNASGGSILEGLRLLREDKSETKELPKDLFVRNASLLKGEAGEIPILFTEWNSNAIFSAYTNDTRKTAAYVVKNALLVEKYVAGSSLWCFSDVFEELHFFREEFHGGFGLLTRNGIPKPAFHGMKMLSDIGDTRLQVERADLESDLFVDAFRKNGDIQVIVTDQQMKQGDSAKKEIAISIMSTNKPLKVLLRSITEEKCNPLRMWQSMGSPSDMTPHEIEMIKEKSAMQIEEIPFVFGNDCIEVELKVGVNDVFMIEALM